MKQAIIASILVLVLALSSSAQVSKKEEVNFSDAFQIDSTENFLIPRLVDGDDREDYGKGKGYLPWGDYSNIYIYNLRTKQSRKMFDRLALIGSFFTRRYGYGEERPNSPSPNILPSHIVYLARTEDFNGDHALDSDDPVYLYLSTKEGEQLRQITPKDMHVLSWTVSRDKKTILVKMQSDKNRNKKFGNGDDQLYYRIDLDTDISKVQCYPLNL